MRRARAAADVRGAAPERSPTPGGGVGNGWTAAHAGEGLGWGEDGDPFAELGSVDEASASEGAESLSTAPTLTVENDQADPSGGQARSKVGVGEISWIVPSVDGGTWSATDGTGVVDGDAWKWIAPATPGSFAVTYRLGQATVKQDLRVVAPDSVTGTKTGDVSFDAGAHGSGMTLDLVFGPTDVSFANLGWLERQGAIRGTGIFQGREPPIRHAEDWALIGGANSIQDTAEHHGFGKPWGEGVVTYDIDQMYRVGAAGTPTRIATAVQTHQMFGTNGATETRKAGATSTRRTP